MILIINGSPNTKSKTMSIVNELLRNCQEEIHVIDSYKSNIISCNDCQYCNKIIGCSKDDDFEMISNLLSKASTLIIASPIYFGGLSDQTMKIINRFQQYFGHKYHIKNSIIPKPMNIILVTSQGSKKSFMMQGPKSTLKILTSLFNPTNSVSIMIPSTDKFSPLDQQKTFKLIKKIKRKIIRF